jgi:hypothetical protein
MVEVPLCCVLPYLAGLDEGGVFQGDNTPPLLDTFGVGV